MSQIHTHVDTRKFHTLTAAGVAGAILILPYSIQLAESTGSPFEISTYLLSTTVMLIIITYLGLWMATRINLKITPVLDKNIRPKEILKPSAIAGAAAAALIIAIGNIEYLFSETKPDIASQLSAQPSFIARFLASFYGGITEELMLRLFTLTLIAFIATAAIGFARKKQEWKPSKKTMQAAIVMSSILFGVAHLPAASLTTVLTPLIIAKIVILNSVGGLAFGWLYWKNGLESAMLAHFTADIIIQLVWPAILTLLFL